MSPPTPRVRTATVMSDSHDSDKHRVFDVPRARGDDSKFREWCAEHSDLFVVVTERRPRAPRVALHRATWTASRQTSPPAGTCGVAADANCLRMRSASQRSSLARRVSRFDGRLTSASASVLDGTSSRSLLVRTAGQEQRRADPDTVHGPVDTRQNWTCGDGAAGSTAWLVAQTAD